MSDAPFAGLATPPIHEVDFCGQVQSAANIYLRTARGLAFTEARIEGRAKGPRHLRRRDLSFLGEDGRVGTIAHIIGVLKEAGEAGRGGRARASPAPPRPAIRPPTRTGAARGRGGAARSAITPGGRRISR